MRLSIAFLLICISLTLSAASQVVRQPAGGSGKANARPTPTPVESVATNQEPPPDGEVISFSTQIASVPVRVMDRKGRFVAGLTQSDFSVTENGEAQDIALFANESEPFTVVLMLDMSYSSTFKIAEIQAAAIAFIDQLRPQDRVMVVSFDDETHILCEPTGDRKAIYKAIFATKIDTGTSLYEAVGNVMNDYLRKTKGRKAVILFSDGVDTSSRTVGDLDNLNDAMELDSLIYVIRYDTYADVQAMKDKPAGPPPIKAPGTSVDKLKDILGGVATPGGPGTNAEDYERAKEYLQGLTERTGGRLYEARTIGNLADAYKKIASELREFYSIGYYPKTERITGQRATIKIKVARPGLVVRARDIFITRRKDTKIK